MEKFVTGKRVHLRTARAHCTYAPECDGLCHGTVSRAALRLAVGMMVAGVQALPAVGLGRGPVFFVFLLLRFLYPCAALPVT